MASLAALMLKVSLLTLNQDVPGALRLQPESCQCRVQVPQALACRDCPVSQWLCTCIASILQWQCLVLRASNLQQANLRLSLHLTKI